MIAQNDELSDYYDVIEFDCCGHPKLEEDRPICETCGYQWYDELDDIVNRRTAYEEWARIKEERAGYGQATLSDYEISRLPIGNQYTNDLTIIEWQCVKAAALEHDISDWTAKVDKTLTYSENIALMEPRSLKQSTHLL